jgi:hypothetical protein
MEYILTQCFNLLEAREKNVFPRVATLEEGEYTHLTISYAFPLISRQLCLTVDDSNLSPDSDIPESDTFQDPTDGDYSDTSDVSEDDIRACDREGSEALASSEVSAGQQKVPDDVMVQQPGDGSSTSDVSEADIGAVAFDGESGEVVASSEATEGQQMAPDDATFQQPGDGSGTPDVSEADIGVMAYDGEGSEVVASFEASAGQQQTPDDATFQQPGDRSCSDSSDISDVSDVSDTGIGVMAFDREGSEVIASSKPAAEQREALYVIHRLSPR